MSRFLVILSLLLIVLSQLTFGQVQQVPKVLTASDLQSDFIKNEGQWPGNFLYKASIPDGFFYLEQNGFTFSFYNGEQLEKGKHNGNPSGKLNMHAIKVRFMGSNHDVAIKSEFPSETYYNFYLGKQPDKWKTGLHAWGKVTYENIYNGIDLEVFTIGGNIKFNFLVKPGANPLNIALKYEGADQLELQDGKLHILTSVNSFWEYIPEVYQSDENHNIGLKCSYYLDENILRYDFPAGFDLNLPMTIDPVVVFSTFSGSWADNFGYTATYDDSGYAYSGGTVFFDSFPVTPGAYQRKWAGGIPGNPNSGNDRDVGILKYSPDGTKLIYATYLGGSGNEDPHSMVVNHNFELIVFGSTNSTDFPIGQTFYDSSYNDSGDVYLAKFSPDGSVLRASSYLGGNRDDGVNGYFDVKISYCNQSRLGYNYGDTYRGEVIVDDKDRVYIASVTKSRNFPIVGNVIQSKYGGGLQDAFVARLSSDLSKLESSTYIGGSDDDAAYALALTSLNQVYVCGGTRSSDLKMGTSGFLKSYQGGSTDGFLYFLSNDFDTLLAATYFGTNRYDQAYFVQTDPFDFPYLTGQTRSDSFFIKNIKYSKYRYHGRQFISKFEKNLDSLLFSTVFGSGNHYPDLSPSAFLVDHCGRIYLSGWGGTTNWVNCYNQGETFGLPTSLDAPQRITDGSDFYVAVFAQNMDTLLYATYWGDPLTSDHVDGGTSRFDKNSIIYQSVCGGCGMGANSKFPTTTGAWSEKNHGHRPKNSQGVYSASGCNNALFKIDLDIPDLVANFRVDTIFCKKDYTHITNLSYGASNFIWDFGDGDTSHAAEPLHFYKDTGTFVLTLVAHNPASCDLFDTIRKKIIVYDQAIANFSFDSNLCVNVIDFTSSSKYGQSFLWNFGDTNTSKEKNPQHIYEKSGSYPVQLTVDSGTVCEVRVADTVHVGPLPLAGWDVVLDTCKGTATFQNSSVYANTYWWYFGDGDSSSLKTPTHSYKLADTFDVLQIVQPNSACADSVQKQLVITRPHATIDAVLDSCSYDLMLYSKATVQDAYNVWILPGVDTITRADTAHFSFDSSGTYNIVLYANSGSICVDTILQTVSLPVAPVADFEKRFIACNPWVQFENKSKNSLYYNWRFGNGSTSQKQMPDSVFYDSSGKYIVQLMAESQQHCIDTFTDTLNIENMAVARLGIHQQPCETSVTFENLSDDADTFYWYFGNGRQSNLKSPGEITYDTAGTYLVKLIVIDGPCIDSTKQILVINEPPQVDFEFKTDSCFPVVSFIGKASGVIDNRYLWAFGDSSNAYVSNVDYQYKSSGNYQVTFTINYDTFCEASRTKIIQVNDYMDNEIIIPNIFTPNGDGKNEIFHIKGLNFECDKYELIIYNRWGQHVFKSQGDQLDWDGYIDGVKASEGTYYYVFKSSRLSQAGTITLIY